MVTKRVSALRGLLAIIMVVALLAIGACAAQPAAPTAQAPAPQPTSASQPPASEKPVVLKFASHAPPTNPIVAQGYLPLLKELEEKSKGRIKIEYYHAEALLKSADMWDGTVKGVTDLSWTVFSYTPALPLLSDLTGLPLGYPTGSVGGKGLLRLYKEGLLDKELDKAKILAFDPTGPAGILSKQPTKAPADMRGKSYRAAGELHTKLVKALGGNPVALPIADAYQALERGVVDGAVTARAPAGSFKLNDIAKNYTDLKLGGLATGLVMNKASYEALPKDLQGIVDEVLGGQRATAFLGQADDGIEDNFAKNVFPKAGVTTHTLSDAEMAAFTQLLEPMWREWATAMEAKGLQAKKVISRWIEVMKELGYTVPIKPSF